LNEGGLAAVEIVTVVRAARRAAVNDPAAALKTN